MAKDDVGYEFIHHKLAEKNGFKELLDYLLEETSILLDYWGNEYNDNSIVIQMGNPRVGGRNIFSVWPNKCSREKGLWLGYSDGNYRSVFRKSFPSSALPNGFLNQPCKQHNNLWHFGWLKSRIEIDPLITACDQD